MTDTPTYFCFKTTDREAAKKLIDFLNRLKTKPDSSHLYLSESVEGLVALLTHDESKDD